MNQRIAVVTGGIGGLGTAICIALAQAGRRVVAADLGVRTERIAEFQRETEGMDIRFEPVDVTDFESCGALARRIEAEFGSIDILAWHPSSGHLLVVEVKSVVADVQATLAGIDRKARVAAALARGRGWAPGPVAQVPGRPGHRTTPPSLALPPAGRTSCIMYVDSKRLRLAGLRYGMIVSKTLARRSARSRTLSFQVSPTGGWSRIGRTRASITSPISR